jgi:serine/threonine protein kinase
MAMAEPHLTSLPDQNDEQTRIVTRAARGSALAPQNMLGNTYVILALLARGGMGEVYLAKHVELGTEHAIKVILPSLAKDPKIVDAFREEARKLGRVHNDAIVRYEGFFRDEHGLRYLVMEFVRGQSLEQVLRRRRLEPDEVLRLRDRLALGLAAAHEKDIVHRDVSPENIILPGGEVDRAKLIDFGIAKATDTGETTLIGGKYSYMSPEQVGLFGGRVDLRSDIYSLGLVLATAAIGFGKKLDMGSSPIAIVAARERIPDLSAVPAVLRPSIAAMLEPRPENRPPSMRALLDQQLPQTAAAPVPQATDKSRSPKGRRALAFAIGVALIVSLSVVAGIFHWGTLPPSVEELRAQFAAATEGYECGVLNSEVATDRSARVSGHLPTQSDVDGLRRKIHAIRGVEMLAFSVGLMVRPYCQVVALLTPLLEQSTRAVPTLSLAVPGEVRVKDRLMLDIRAPGFDGYLYVDYFDSEGNVGHLFPNDRDVFNLRPARNAFVLGRPPMARCWVFDGNTGQQLVTLVAATKPLFSKRLPDVEDARGYIASLAEAIGKLPSNSAAAAVLFFDLHEAAASPNQATGCPSG